jgi:hypothetical protein
MSIQFTAEEPLTNIIATILIEVPLSAQGVRWLHKIIPQNRYVNGRTLPEMRQDFMKAAGQVIICQMCMKNVGGIKKE